MDPVQKFVVYTSAKLWPNRWMIQNTSKYSNCAISGRSNWSISRIWQKDNFCLKFLIKKYEGLVYRGWIYQKEFQGSKTFGVCNIKSIWYTNLDKRTIMFLKKSSENFLSVQPGWPTAGKKIKNPQISLFSS